MIIRDNSKWVCILIFGLKEFAIFPQIKQVDYFIKVLLDSF